MPKGKYKGQKLRKLVRIKIPARIKLTIANDPEITSVKYKPIITIAIRILTTLSVAPMFVFIVLK
jgi:hypothetical protein